jgi:hypothetical protein
MPHSFSLFATLAPVSLNGKFFSRVFSSRELLPLLLFPGLQDGKTRSLLDKYDEEEADDEFKIGEDGCVDTEKLKRQRDIRAKLAAQVTGEKEDLRTETKAISDFYTSEEMSSLFKPTKKKKKKEKKLRQKDTSDLIAALEAEAAAKGPEGGGGGDFGNRRSQVNREDTAAKEELEKVREGRKGLEREREG